ncbi:sensor histidine kinase [Clostridium tetanomorphum]
MTMIRKLCREYTNLSNKDIEKLENIEDILQGIADLAKADVFIDCPTRDTNEAIVVAEAKPTTVPSMYTKTVVGQLALRDNEPAALRTLELGRTTINLKAVTQENANVTQKVAPIKNNEGRTIGVLILEQDITEHINNNRHMKMLKETTEQLTETIVSLSNTNNEENITYHLNDAIIIFNSNGIAVFSNPVANLLYKKLGYKDKIVGMNFENLVLDGRNFNNMVEDGDSIISEVTVGKLCLQIKYILTKPKNDRLKMLMIVRDITEVKEKEKELILKSVAIKEIHHRVKNNLQTIASLLRLQSRRIDNELTKDAFNESISRILSIAATHEILAQNGVDDVDIKEVILRIKENILRFFSISSRNIEVNVEGDSLNINSDKATSIALIVNEILQNSLEHAFVDKNEGKINIQVEQGTNYCKLSIEDNGRGFDPKCTNPENLGLNIVRSIVKDKLNGSLNIYSGNKGTKVEFDFKN